MQVMASSVPNSKRRPDTVLEPPLALANSGHAVLQLRQAIVAGRFRPGERLIEVQLAEQLGLSRGPIRVALQQLSQEGLVELRPNRGAVVASIRPDDVLEVYAIRASLGSLALRHLIRARRMTPKVLANLERLARRAKSDAARRNQSVLVKYDLEFQSALAEASGLKRVAGRFRELSVELQMFVNALQVHYADVDRILDEHDQLLDAIRHNDLKRAEHVWRGRFRRAVDEFLQLMPGGIHELETKPWLISAVEDDPA